MIQLKFSTNYIKSQFNYIIFAPNDIIERQNDQIEFCRKTTFQSALKSMLLSFVLIFSNDLF